VRDERLHEKAVESIRRFVVETPGWSWQGLIASPIKGMDGNQEFLAWLVREA
jgi:predicted rRNA methylase YqxC with S4 and FtsJ domains